MRNTFIAAALLGFAAASSADAATAQNPAVVELFTSQGCSSCPPANANIIALASRPDVLALSFDVTYWDDLGWRDTFDDEAYTDRQRDYEPGLRERSPFTPQVVVDGRTDTVGNVRKDIEKLIAQSHRDGGPSLHLAADNVSVDAGQGAGEVWLVRYDPRVVNVPIARGENKGTTQPQINVVHQLAKLGDWKGQVVQFALPPGKPELKTAILIQRSHGGPIIAAARD